MGKSSFGGRFSEPPNKSEHQEMSLPKDMEKIIVRWENRRS